MIKALNGITVFARRNMLETLRSPVSWIFGLLLPVGIFTVMQIIVKSIGDAAAHVPMFGVSRFTGGVLLFGASFMSLFCAMLISGDRAQSFSARLSASPLGASDFILGYMLGALPIALVQSAITFITALCFSLTPTVNILPAFVFSVLFDLLFIAIGVALGSCLGAKNAPPVCSVVVQVAALLSGMWFDLDTIGGGFAVFCKCLPFANCYDLIRYTLAGEWGSVLVPFLVTFAYTAAFIGIAVACYGYRSKRV